MRIVSFDAFRSLFIPNVRYIKPELFLQHLPLLQEADWLLFPEYWQVNSLYYGLGARLFPSISSYHLGHDKVEMSRLFQVICPEHIPDTEIHSNSAGARQMILERFTFPFVAKTVRSSEGRGVYLIQNEEDWHCYCEAHEVLYVQKYLPIDRDLRLVVIGKGVVAHYWRLQSTDGFRNNLAAGGRLDFSPPPMAAVELVNRLARLLNIDHAGFDVAVYQDQVYILEFNRLFGNRGLIEQGIRPAGLIYDYLLEQNVPHRTPPNNQPSPWCKTG